MEISGTYKAGQTPSMRIVTRGRFLRSPPRPRVGILFRTLIIQIKMYHDLKKNTVNLFPYFFHSFSTEFLFLFLNKV